MSEKGVESDAGSRPMVASFPVTLADTAMESIGTEKVTSLFLSGAPVGAFADCVSAAKMGDWG